MEEGPSRANDGAARALGIDPRLIEQPPEAPVFYTSPGSNPVTYPPHMPRVDRERPRAGLSLEFNPLPTRGRDIDFEEHFTPIAEDNKKARTLQSAVVDGERIDRNAPPNSLFRDWVPGDAWAMVNMHPVMGVDRDRDAAQHLAEVQERVQRQTRGLDTQLRHLIPRQGYVPGTEPPTAQVFMDGQARLVNPNHYVAAMGELIGGRSRGEYTVETRDQTWLGGAPSDALVRLPRQRTHGPHYAVYQHDDPDHTGTRYYCTLQ